MKKLEASDEFKEVDEALSKYSTWPEKVRDDVQKLRRKHEQMITQAKDKLLDASGATSPAEIKKAEEDHVAYGDNVRREMEALSRYCARNVRGSGVSGAAASCRGRALDCQ